MTAFPKFTRSLIVGLVNVTIAVRAEMPLNVSVDREAPIRFVATAYEPHDWAAIFLKSFETGCTAQRVGPVSWIQGERCQSWLRAMNARTFNVYISVNAIAAGRHTRKRDAIGAIRHVFLEADREGADVLARVERRPDLPKPSYVLHSSPGRVHLFWRVKGFNGSCVEQLQKELANELHTDPAATPITQNTRLPGFFNHKHKQPHLVTIEYRDVERLFGPEDFPPIPESPPQPLMLSREPHARGFGVVERARRYLAFVPPAISGEHGDVHTFRICCRLTRGFALDEHQALAVLSEWNQRCEPPWTAAELVDKLRSAARYGREPIGGLL